MRIPGHAHLYLHCIAVSAVPLRWSSSLKGFLRPLEAGKKLNERDATTIYKIGSGTRKVNRVNGCSLLLPGQKSKDMKLN